MKTYKISSFLGQYAVTSLDGSDSTRSFGLKDMGNRDCVKFLQDWKDGAEVLDADGNPLPYSDEALAALEVK